VSTVTYGPPVSLDGPLPVAPKHSLLTIPGVLLDEAPGHWMNGAALWAYPHGQVHLWEPCSTGTERVKAEGEELLTPMFGPFVGYLPITCSSMSIGDPDEFRDRARAAMDARESWAVERALSQGIINSANPFYSDGNMDLLGGPFTPAIGLAYLEDAIGELGIEGLIQAPPAIASRWGYDKLRRYDVVRTANGTPVAIGGGYAGALGQTGTVDVAFATTHPRVMHAEVNVLEIADVLDRETNDVTYRAERFVVAAWDTALQAGVLIDWAT
jgi:hypothetical protein